MKLDNTSTNVKQFPAIEKKEVGINNLNEIIELAKINERTFYIRFLETFPDFSKKLLGINSQLTNSDLEYCALIKLKFQNKEIAFIKRNSVSSVESKKYRIRKKLGINTHDDIYNWMNNI